MDGVAAIGLISLAVTLAVGLFALGVYRIVEGPRDVTVRVDAYAARTLRLGQDDERQGGLKGLLSRLDRLLSGQSFARRLALQLAQANVLMTVPEYLGLWGAVTLGGGLLGYLLQRHLLSVVAGAAFGFAIPCFWLARRRRARLQAFQDQLVDALVLIVGSLRSGHGLLNAMEIVAGEMNAPAADEFSRVLREVGFGLSQNEALENLAERMDSDDLRLMVTAININQEVGGNLAFVLDKIAETIRERMRLLGEVRVLTTQQRLTSYLLVGLPFVLGGVIGLINPSWMAGLFVLPWIVIPGLALVFSILGFLVTRRLMRIEV